MDRHPSISLRVRVHYCLGQALDVRVGWHGGYRGVLSAPHVQLQHAHALLPIALYIYIIHSD